MLKIEDTKDISKPMLDIFEFLGDSDYYIKCIDCENCICRKIGNYEIELSNCDRNKMSVNLYVWELANAGAPKQVVADKCGISSKPELKEVINYIETNIENIARCGHIKDAACSSSTVCRDIQDNHGIIGATNAPVTVINK